jgi:two-component system, cell cycle sensor histidine kinase and response regulator CckA
MASVLIVEDDRVNAMEMAETMEAAGHEIVGVTSSGDQALTLAEKTQPELALVDVKLNGATDGIAVASSLQDRLDVAVVYVTGYSDQAVLKRAIRDAAYGYVLKPFDARTLEAACTLALSLRNRDRGERERKRAERLDSLATLAAGIAHDFNNMLAIMHNCAALAKQAAPENLRVQSLLNDLEHAGNRASALTAELVSFAKGGDPIRRPKDLIDLVNATLPLALRGSAVALHVDIAEDVWRVSIDDMQMSQVFTNLALNARQAMNDNGKLHVRARNRLIGEGDPILPKGRFVDVSITDHGPGINGEHLEKIFDPFFTTRDNGTGLGLSSAYSIAKRHGGALRAESVVGRGTTFHVLIPAAAPDAKVPTIPPPVEPSPASQGLPAPDAGRVLIMDDEPDLRRVLALCLEELGYEVEQTADGQAACAAYDQALRDGRRFDLAILDLTIRGGDGGVATLERLRELDPAVTAIATSGYSDSPVLSDHERHGFAGGLAKPYRFAMLAQVLRKASGKAARPKT